MNKREREREREDYFATLNYFTDNNDHNLIFHPERERETIFLFFLLLH